MIFPTTLDTAVWNNTEAVTYESAQYVDPFTFATTPLVFALATAKRLSLTRRELAASGGAYTGLDRKWYVPKALFPPGTKPKPGDAVVDAEGVRWVALEVNHQDMGGTYRLTCRDLVIAWDLRDRVDVERAALANDAAGAPVKAFPPHGGLVAYPQLVCRVQPEEESVHDIQGIRGPQTRYRVIVAQQLAVSTEDRLNWRGRLLDIEKYENARQIGELPFITAVLQP